MFLNITTTEHTMRKGKVIVLCHDNGFRPITMTDGGTYDALELDIFLEKATKSGYHFKTIDTYPLGID